MANRPKLLDLSAPKPEHLRNPDILKPKSITGVVGVSGTLPLKQGDVGEIQLTPEEETELKKYGWEPGMLVPGDLPQQIRTIQQQLEEELQTLKPKPDDFKPKIPNTVDISELQDEGARSKIKQYIKDFQTLAPQIAAANEASSRLAQLTPGVQKAIVSAQQRGVAVFDSRSDKKTYNNVEEIQSKINQVEGKDMPETTGLTESRVEIEDGIDLIDKSVYLTCMSALKPFEKTYGLMGGRVTVTFRHLTGKQYNRIMKELARKAKDDDLASGEALQLGQTYRMILGLVSVAADDIELDVEKQIHNCQLTEGSYRKVNPDGIEQLDDVVQRAHENPVLDPIWTLLLKISGEFAELVAKLEDRAKDPDFWPAIGG